MRRDFDKIINSKIKEIYKVICLAISIILIHLQELQIELLIILRLSKPLFFLKSGSFHLFLDEVARFMTEIQDFPVVYDMFYQPSVPLLLKLLSSHHHKEFIVTVSCFLVFGGHLLLKLAQPSAARFIFLFLKFIPQKQFLDYHNEEMADSYHFFSVILVN